MMWVPQHEENSRSRKELMGANCGLAGEASQSIRGCRPFSVLPTLLSWRFAPIRRQESQIPELQVCIAEALYDIESIFADPGAVPEQERMRLRDQIVNNLQRAWEITGRGEDELASTMLQISQVVARELKPSS
jgi:hypothetical protein